MKRSLVFILAGGLVLGLVSAGGYLYMTQQSSKTPDIADSEIRPTPAPKLIVWDDPAGFSISYPEGLAMNKHDEDKINYAHLEFTDSSHPGSVTVWVKDLPKGVTDSASWSKKMSTPSAALSFDTTLGGKEAKKILISQPQKTSTVGLVFDGVLWYAEAALIDEAYWQPVYDSMLQSFAFTPAPTSSAGNGASSGGSDEAVDEEEVLE